ncbi:hypothetical protein HMPREF0972_01701 [Actinomyces sp. oral taxon 848 str. F0332]|nr:hypothetical protein HMPREF0972_01701 [Actinomyces sp. oral taxon 848 str. F0332]
MPIVSCLWVIFADAHASWRPWVSKGGCVRLGRVDAIRSRRQTSVDLTRFVL